MNNKNSSNLQEEIVRCPFNTSHQVQKSKLVWHFQKCQDKLAKEHLYIQCRYNSVHWMPIPKIGDHLKKCPDRPTQKEQSESNQEELDLKAAIAKQFGNNRRVNDSETTEPGKKKRIRGKNKDKLQENDSCQDPEKEISTLSKEISEIPVSEIKHVPLNWARTYSIVMEKRKKPEQNILDDSVVISSETYKNKSSCSANKDSQNSNPYRNVSSENHGDDEHIENSSSYSKEDSYVSIPSKKSKKNRNKTQSYENPYSKPQMTNTSKEQNISNESSRKESFSVENPNELVKAKHYQDNKESCSNEEVKKLSFDFREEDEVDIV